MGDLDDKYHAPNLSKFNSLDMDHVKDLVVSGMDERRIALELGVSTTTITKWKRQHPHFRDAMAAWKYVADTRVEKSLYERAMGYSHVEEKIFCNKDGEVTRVETVKHYPPDVTACIFWLKNRQKEHWRDRIDHEHSGKLDFAQSILDARQRARVVNNEAIELDENIDLLE